MRYTLRAPSGEVLDSGEAAAEVSNGTLVVAPTVGQPLYLQPRDVVSVDEPEPYLVRLRLREGPSLILMELGALRTQLLEQFHTARGDDLVSSLLLSGLGRPVAFPGAINGAEAELRLYDDALIGLPVSGDPVQLPYSFIESVETDTSGYQLLISTGEAEPIVVQRLARRTTEFLDLLRSRVSDARGRTSAFLAALLPGLGPIALRSAAGLLRDGVAAPKTALDAIDPGIWPGLLASSTIADRVAAATTLIGMGEPWLGYQQSDSVARAAEGGGSGWQPPAPPVLTGHDRTSGGLGTGVGGMFGAQLMRGGLAGTVEPWAAMALLGLSPMLNQPDGRTPTGRTDTSRSSLTPAGTDLAALTATGTKPTVLAFLLVDTGSRVVVEVLNEADHASYVFRGGPGALRRLNRGLSLLHYQVSAITEEAGLNSKYATAIDRLEHLKELRSAFIGRVIHTENWASQLTRLLA